MEDEIATVDKADLSVHLTPYKAISTLSGGRSNCHLAAF